MVLFRNGTDKNRFRTHFFLSFPTSKRSPSFWNRSASFFPEPVVLVRQSFTVNLMRFTPYIFAAIWQIKRRKLHHEKLQHMKAVEPSKDYEVEMLSGMLRHVLNLICIKSENNHSFAAICLKALKLGKPL